MENKIRNFVGENGKMEKILFENGESVDREGGFVLPQLIQSSNFAKQLGCEYNPLGGISADSYGRTNIQGVYLGFSIPAFFQILSLISKLRKTRYNFLLNMPPILKI